MTELTDAKILDSWQKNAAAWTQAIRNKEVKSRELITNAAIINAITSRPVKSALDIGCGEGWLVRALIERDIATVGVDAVAELVEKAESSGEGTYKVLSYEDIAQGMMDKRFDVVVCNFSLLGESSVEGLFNRFADLLNDNGRLIIQTLHPLTADGDYSDGWRKGSWSGFSEQFTDPAPWYFRTLESWQALFTDNRLKIIAQKQPKNKETGEFASIIFIAQKQDSDHENR